MVYRRFAKNLEGRGMPKGESPSLSRGPGRSLPNDEPDHYTRAFRRLPSHRTQSRT